jgi:hypothetical protein
VPGPIARGYVAPRALGQSFALRDDGYGLAFGEGGLCLGEAPLLAARAWSNGGLTLAPRPAAEVAALLGAAYGDEFEAERRLSGLAVVAEALNRGNPCKAVIAALHLRLPDLDDAARRRLARAERLLKAGFDPRQPRVPAGHREGGQWRPAGGGGGGSGGGGTRPSRLTRPMAGFKLPSWRTNPGATPAAADHDPTNPLRPRQPVLLPGGIGGRPSPRPVPPPPGRDPGSLTREDLDRASIPRSGSDKTQQIRDLPGGWEKANEYFERLPRKGDIQVRQEPKGTVRIIEQPDGTTVNIRPFSSGNEKTLEVIPPKGSGHPTIKYRIRE